ncbi:hypothetical protein [Zavarzinia sp. CC-PAN008]|uniref:hypothetical protein n=1 Tax=Zavarzinia sp. CC-PAN008 TaxID=3243332 RepID=UPI003F7425AF
MTDQISTAIRQDSKTCFVICPIGIGDVRTRSDDLYNNVVKPICEEFGYRAARIVDDNQPGEITPKIIESIFESDLVIADLTGRNPNVFYELALRHFVAKPYIHLISDINELPFDIKDINVINISGTSFSDLRRIEKELREHIKAAESNPNIFQNVVARYRTHKKIAEDPDPQGTILTQMQDEMAMLKHQVRELSADGARRTHRITSENPSRQAAMLAQMQDEIATLREKLRESLTAGTIENIDNSMSLPSKSSFGEVGDRELDLILKIIGGYAHLEPSTIKTRITKMENEIANGEPTQSMRIKAVKSDRTLTINGSTDDNGRISFKIFVSEPGGRIVHNSRLARDDKGEWHQLYD